MSTTTALKFGVWGICVIVSMLVIFLFVFRDAGYNSYALSTILLVWLTIAVLFVAGWKIVKRAIG